MRSFEYYTPTKVFFGKDTHLKIGELLKDYNCHKVLIHYGSESAVKSGLIHEISKCLTEAGIDFVTLGGVVPNPRLSKVREGISLCQKESVDFILAVGVEVLLILQKPLAMVLPIHGPMSGIFFSKQRFQTPVFQSALSLRLPLPEAK